MSDAMNPLTPDQLNALLQFASKRLGTTPEQLAKTVQTGGPGSIASKLPPEKAAQFSSLAGDQAKMQELLSSPQVQKRIEQLMRQSGEKGPKK
ncbi:MAG TPA: hypothetical protein H9694_10320 [Firmicutes bacterium]|nr:hypothetical protein [Bacillota bacterium]